MDGTVTVCCVLHSCFQSSALGMCCILWQVTVKTGSQAHLAPQTIIRPDSPCWQMQYNFFVYFLLEPIQWVDGCWRYVRPMRVVLSKLCTVNWKCWCCHRHFNEALACMNPFHVHCCSHSIPQSHVCTLNCTILFNLCLYLTLLGTVSGCVQSLHCSDKVRNKLLAGAQERPFCS